MKKSIAGKLCVNKETVSNLDNRELSGVKGGWKTYYCDSDWKCDRMETILPQFCM
ncbi:MAG: hypothetical protein GY765_13395 [bacterium]|nr:hypothetical protein [bacterium]